MDVLLIGEDVRFLRLLSTELSLRGFNVAVASEPDALQPALDLLAPDVVIFDHAEPMDLFAFNPREYGFEGPLLVLSADDIPAACLEAFREARYLMKPFSLVDVCDQLAALTTSEAV